MNSIIQFIRLYTMLHEYLTEHYHLYKIIIKNLSSYNIIRLWFPQLSTIVEHYSFDGDNDLCDILDSYTNNLNVKTANATLSEVCVPVSKGFYIRFK